MNKKGVVIFEIGLWIMRIIMVIVIIAGVTLQIRNYVDVRVNLDVAEPMLLAHVISTAPLFLYQDATGAYHRAIDVERFRSLQEGDLGNRMQLKRHAAAQLTLVDGAQSSSVFWNKDYYAELDAQQKLGIVAAATQSLPIEIIDKGQTRTGVLQVMVLQPS